VKAMFVRDQLQRETALVPDHVVQRLLDYLHEMPPSVLAPAKSQQQGGHFESYWSQWYGLFEGQEWEEPPELPYETREVW